jgi:hypothetical protein
MSEIIDPAGIREEVEEEVQEHEDILDPLGISPTDAQFDPGLAIERNIESEIKEATGLTALEEEQATLEQELAAQRREFAGILEEVEAAPTEASRAAALARRRRRAGATRQSTRVARGRTSPGVTSRTTLGG